MRHNIRMKLFIISVIVSFAYLAPAAGSAYFEEGHEPLVFFGDSLSDSRNYYIDTKQFTVRPFPLVPDHPYLIGWLRFSDGKVWAEYLARALDVTSSGKPALAWPGVFKNYAVGRSRARADDEFVPPEVWNLTEQVDLFLDDVDENVSSEALYVFWIGGNDLRDALEAGIADPSGLTTEAIVEAAIAATIENILDLHAFGADEFLVLNMPNIAHLPAVELTAAALGIPGLLEQATKLTVAYNAGLEEALGHWEGVLGDTIEIRRFDIFSLFEALLADPDAYGFSNATDPCIVPDVWFDAICASPDEHIFWDGVHPTTSLHAFLAGKVHEFLVD